MAKSFVDQKARTGIPGVAGLSKVVNQNSWGDAKAVERGYGSGTRTFPSPKDGSQPQFRDEQPTRPNQGAIPVDSWLRGGGECGKPPRGRK
jgi:hypothetical protein